ncbi:MAG: DUF503 domain-containing protein [Thermoflexus sp.]|nr:DUF503 domain-containing protein [Thermoflexus sp.]
MVIGTCTVDLHLPGAQSLKDKRSVMKSLIAHLRQSFNVAAAEIDHQDFPQSARLGLATISNDAGHIHAILESAVRWIEANRPDIMVVDWEIAIL